MFIPLSKRGWRAFSGTDLIVTLSVLFLLTTLGMAVVFHKKRSQAGLVCANNLKSVTLAMKMWPPDSTHESPWQHHSLGSSHHTNSGLVLPHCLALTGYLASPKLLTCPADSRSSVVSWQTLNDSNISYFINFDAQEVRPAQVAFGDRRFTSTMSSVSNLLILGTNSTYRWEQRIHNGLGNVSFADGSVRRVVDRNLQLIFHDRENVGSRIQLPK